MTKIEFLNAQCKGLSPINFIKNWELLNTILEDRPEYYLSCASRYVNPNTDTVQFEGFATIQDASMGLKSNIIIPDRSLRDTKASRFQIAALALLPDEFYQNSPAHLTLLNIFKKNESSYFTLIRHLKMNNFTQLQLQDRQKMITVLLNRELSAKPVLRTLSDQKGTTSGQLRFPEM